MKLRLDSLLVEQQLATDLKHAQSLIGAGHVLINDVRADKPGSVYPIDVSIRIKSSLPYVSRGGLKLDKAFDTFPIDAKDKTCIDIGASTGGFTDCLLQKGAEHIFAVDVAYGQFSWKLRQDERVTVFERFNARNITKDNLAQGIDLAVIDASFISLTKLIPPLLPLFVDKPEIIALIKPQFELPKNLVGKGGVVRDEGVRLQAVHSIINFCENIGLISKGFVESPIKGPKGNREYLIHIVGK